MFRRIIFCTSVFSMLLMGTGRMMAQTLNINEIIQSGSDDMNTYMGFYTEPFMDAFGTGINSGWYNTAKPHDKLGFDLSFTASLVVVPDENRLFTFRESDYNNLKLTSGATTAELPTLMGPDPQPPEELVVDGTVLGQTVLSPPFDAPGGIQGDLPTSAALAPMITLGIGIVKNTDLMIRWTPKFKFGTNDNFKVLGFGLKHDIKQWIPGLRTAPFGLSVLIAYTKLDGEYTPPSTPIITVGSGSKAFFDLNAWTFQALVSKTFSVLTLYGGLGYNSAKSNLTMTGDYSFFDAAGVGTVTVVDPVNQDFAISGARFTAGMRLKFAVFTLSADYTLQEYNTLTVGFGLSVK